LSGSTTEKLEKIYHWCLESPEVKEFRIISFSSALHDSSSDILYHCNAANSPLFPAKPSLLNGHSAVPKEIFPQTLRHDVTVYYPFLEKSSEPGGALLIKSHRPKQFLKRYHNYLEILASKVGDILRIARLKRSLSEEAESGNGAFTGAMTPSREFMSRFMDKLELPMYVSDRNGRFLIVNRSFLEDFAFSDVENVNREQPFFVDNDTWAKGMD